jgi:hypothetical protein
VRSPRQELHSRSCNYSAIAAFLYTPYAVVSVEGNDCNQAAADQHVRRFKGMLLSLSHHLDAVLASQCKTPPHRAKTRTPARRWRSRDDIERGGRARLRYCRSSKAVVTRLRTTGCSSKRGLNRIVFRWGRSPLDFESDIGAGSGRCRNRERSWAGSVKGRGQEVAPSFCGEMPAKEGPCSRLSNDIFLDGIGPIRRRWPPNTTTAAPRTNPRASAMPVSVRLH